MNIPLLVLILANAIVLTLFWYWLMGWRKAGGDAEGTDTENGFRRLMSRVDSVWKDDLSTDHIRKIEHDIEEEQRELFKLAAVEEEAIRWAITHDDADEVKQIKHRYERLRGYQLAIERLSAARKRLYKKRQRRHVWLRMNQMLRPGGAKALEWSVLILIIVVLVLLFAEFSIGYEKLNSVHVLETALTVLWLFYIIDCIACAVFIFEYFLRLYLAEDKKWFWRHNWIDLASSIPIPPISPEASVNVLLRILRLLRLMRLFRIARILDILWSGMDRLERNTDINLVTKSAGALVVLLILGTSAVTLVEPVNGRGIENVGLRASGEVTNGAQQSLRSGAGFIGVSMQGETGEEFEDPAATTLNDFAETLWWTFNAIAPNAGYADLHEPKEPFTRLVTAMLLLWGAVVMGAFVATLTASFSGERTEELRLKQLELSADLDEVRETQDNLSDRIEGGGSIREKLKRVRSQSRGRSWSASGGQL